jgi:hypothetical protein
MFRNIMMEINLKILIYIKLKSHIGGYNQGESVNYKIVQNINSKVIINVFRICLLIILYV